MKRLTLILTSLGAFGLAACGSPEQSPVSATETAEPAVAMEDHGGMDHGDGSMDRTMEGVAHSTGTVRSVGNQGDFLTIEHGPFTGGFEMGAMTMGFETLGGVDLSGISEGDEVAFMVKQGRDNSFRITAVCNTATNGADCLDGMMDH